MVVVALAVAAAGLINVVAAHVSMNAVVVAGCWRRRLYCYCNNC